jgi:RsiW-degrading membrane proteinase PrsW (M82 family)
MSEIQITHNGQVYTFAPGATVKIGRSSDNDVVINDPTVSRRHAQLSWESSGWVWHNAGQAPTFLAGQPVAQFGVAQVVDVCLASPQGPALRLQAAAAQGPVKTELAGVGGAAAATNAPGQAAPPQGFAQQGAAGPNQPGGPAQGYGQAAAAAAGQAGYPPGGGAPGAAPGYGPGYGPGVTPPGMPGYPGGPVMQAAGIPLSLLDQGSFFEILIPIKSWLHDRGWRQGLRLLIIPYALLPLIFIQLFSTSTSLTTPGWAYSLYVAPLWLLAFWYLIRPPKIEKIEYAVGVGVIILVVILIHVYTIPIEEHFGNPATIPGALVVGYAEETTKAFPVLIAALLLWYGFKKRLDPRNWFLMGTVAGLAFGVYEQAEYTSSALKTIQMTQFSNAADAGVLDFAFRVFVDGFQHAVWAGISGFFIGIAINYRRRGIPLLILGISIPALLHAFNDWSLSVTHTAWLTVLEQALSLLLFLGYTLSASTIVNRVRRNPNFRGQSIMMERFSEPAPEQPV